MSNVVRICQNKNCKKEFTARSADVKRGWAKYCSKSCKAIVQERRTGQNAAYLQRVNHAQENPTFQNAHQFDNTEL